MSDFNRLDRQELDNYITGHYGEDQFRENDGPDGQDSTGPLAPADLEAFEAYMDSESGDAQHNPDVFELRHRLTAVIAELRAARKVVERARFYLGPPDEEGWHFEDCTPDYVDEPAECIPGCPEPQLAEAIAEYDKVSGR